MTRTSRPSTASSATTARGPSDAARRTLLAAPALLGLAALATGVTTVPHPDAALLDAFRRWQPQEAERQAIAALVNADPDNTVGDAGRHVADDRYDAWHKGWHDLMDRAIELPARTPEGVQAKATMLRAMLEHDGVADAFDHDATTISDVLTWSLVRDLLAGGAA